MNYHLKWSLLLLSGFFFIQASEREDIQRAQQEAVYQELEDLRVIGACRLNVNAALAKSVLAVCPKKVSDIIFDIQYGIFFEDQKNIIFYGDSGTGKSVLAQAMAIESQAIFLFFNAAAVAYAGVQNLSAIFKYAKELGEKLSKTCIIIFDELECLTNEYDKSSNDENNICMRFRQELDRPGYSHIVILGTMNSVDNVPYRIMNRTCMIKIPLPSQKHREIIASYYLKEIQNQYNLEFPQWLTAAYFAQQTKRFSNRDIENVVQKALSPAKDRLIASNGSNRMVNFKDVSNAINEIKQMYTDQWKRKVKNYLTDPKIVILLGIVTVGIIKIMRMFNQK